jgi:hypothetical protein
LVSQQPKGKPNQAQLSQLKTDATNKARNGDTIYPVKPFFSPKSKEGEFQSQRFPKQPLHEKSEDEETPTSKNANASQNIAFSQTTGKLEKLFPKSALENDLSTDGLFGRGGGFDNDGFKSQTLQF